LGSAPLLCSTRQGNQRGRKGCGRGGRGRKGEVGPRKGEEGEGGGRGRKGVVKLEFEFFNFLPLYKYLYFS
jgi:hypothetical protein